MKIPSLDISIARKAERPFPNREIIWNSQNGGISRFPTLDEARERKWSEISIPLQTFSNAVADAQERIWIVDEYLFKPDDEDMERRIEQIMNWLPVSLAASDIRFLTRQTLGIDESVLSKFKQHAQEINDYAARREKHCSIEIKTHLAGRDCNFIHDRFAIVDDELWHFGATVGGLHTSVSAASRGWNANDNGAIEFFNKIWGLKK